MADKGFGGAFEISQHMTAISGLQPRNVQKHSVYTFAESVRLGSGGAFELSQRTMAKTELQHKKACLRLRQTMTVIHSRSHSAGGSKQAR